MQPRSPQIGPIWVETQDNPPPSPLTKLPSQPSLPQHRRHFTRLQWFQAAQHEGLKSAFQAGSDERFPLGLSSLHMHEVLSIPIGASPKGVTEGTSVDFMCSNVVAVRLLPCPSCSLNWMPGITFSLLHCVLRTPRRCEFAAIQQRTLPGGTTGMEGSSHCFMAGASNSSLSFNA